MDLSSIGSSVRWLGGKMDTRLIAVVAVIIAVAVGVLGYGIGVSNQEVGLTTEQRNEIQTIVGQALESPSEQATPSTEFSALSDDRRSEIEALIRSHLLANPDIITDAIDELRARQGQAELAAVSDVIAANAQVIFDSDRQVVIGNPQGDVTLVEFFDYNCPYCRGMVADVQRLIEEDPGLRVVLKEFPVLEEGSVEAARVAVAIRLTAPEKYQAFHLALLSEPGSVNGDRALAVAEEIGIDPETLRPLLDSTEVAETINEVYEIADLLNVNGTPSFVTANEVLEGAVAIETLRSKIAEVRSN